MTDGHHYSQQVSCSSQALNSDKRGLSQMIYDKEKMTFPALVEFSNVNSFVQTQGVEKAQDTKHKTGIFNSV